MSFTLCYIQSSWQGAILIKTMMMIFIECLPYEQLWAIYIYIYIYIYLSVHSVQFSLVAQSCPTLCNPMNQSTPGLPVHHQLLEFTQTHVHRVGDAIQPSHPLSSPFPPVPNPSQHIYIYLHEFIFYSFICMCVLMIFAFSLYKKQYNMNCNFLVLQIRILTHQYLS